MYPSFCALVFKITGITRYLLKAFKLYKYKYNTCLSKSYLKKDINDQLITWHQ